MTEQQTYDGDWIAAWITRQRDILAQSSRSGANADAEAAEHSRRWAETGQAFFEGLQRAGAAGAGASATLDPFNVGAALMGAWTQAMLVQSKAAEQIAELLQRVPAIGLAREQTQAWREVAAAHAECKRLEHELRAVLAKVQLDALDLLERQIRERAGAPLNSFRELYELWVECGEQIYGKVARSEAYSKLQAELGNATMRLKRTTQTVIEYGLRQFDLPTRSELNSLHRQVRDLRVEVERLRNEQPSASPQQARPRKQKARPR
jgi:class III poly(R)-hydroxyalkanoic acid synthase PhaE subunit